MKNLQITADWILCNFSHTGSYPGDGTGSFFVIVQMRNGMSLRLKEFLMNMKNLKMK
jgi:hypothetical protein